MQIPSILLVKTNKFSGKVNRIIEEGWNYLRGYFKNLNDYFVFLENLSQNKFEQFLHTVFFYWAHDLYRLTKKEIKDPNIDGFMYQITLSIVEYLNKQVSTRSRERIKDFFIKYFSDFGKDKLKKEVKARPIKNKKSFKKESWEILYDMRNKFVHEAGWFNMKFGGAFTSLSVIRNKEKPEVEYFADIGFQYREYLELFWEAYIKYFQSKKSKN